jgi:hypothetical protein
MDIAADVIPENVITAADEIPYVNNARDAKVARKVFLAMSAILKLSMIFFLFD